ncbi:MAG TPA: TonB-dependent receptor, partial [Porphyromonadaceae bacterium]|nr:TonB-dependent receptor [Porphyromonadaceae bacterium]
MFGSSTSYQRNQSDGWQLSNVTLDKNGELVHTDAQTSQRFQSNILSQRFTLSPTEKLSLYAEGSLYDKKFKRPKTVTDYNMLYEDYTAGLGGRYLLKKNGYLSLDMNTDNFDYSQIYINENKAHKVGDESLVRRQQYYHANLKGVFGMGKFNKLSVGAEYRLDYLKHVDVTGGEKDVYNTALYAQDEIRLLNNRLQIVPGVRYVYHETFKNRLTPKISAMYSLDNMNFRASYAAGFRAPDLKQLYYYSEGKTTITFGNTDLKPESSDYYSAGIEYYSHNFTVSVNGYLNEVKNIIEKESIPREPGDP